MKVKICGITNLADALAACEAGADALGFNFSEEAKKRRRYIDPDAARLIISQLPPFVMSVAVSVNADPARYTDWLQFVDLLQLHGDESPQVVAPVAHKTIKVFRAAPDFDTAAMLSYPCRAHLLDAYVSGDPGGTGTTCDWNTAQKAAESSTPLILAGGLTPDNVAQAINTVRPYAVDTAGGVESEPGKKDHERIRDFIRNAKTLPLS
jgi:phosphoribosylanthranilate isomerase